MSCQPKHQSLGERALFYYLDKISMTPKTRKRGNKNIKITQNKGKLYEQKDIMLI